MKNILLISSAIFFSASAMGMQIKNAKCSDLNNVKETVKPQYLAVIDGYNKSGKKVSEEVDIGEIVTDSKRVSDSCAKNQTAKISSIKTTPTKTTTGSMKFNPAKSNCKDFVALGEDVQPVAAFWVAGHDKTGKLKSGEVDEEFLASPVATLVEDCRLNPTASFYDRTKSWIKKHL